MISSLPIRTFPFLAPRPAPVPPVPLPVPQSPVPPYLTLFLSALALQQGWGGYVGHPWAAGVGNPLPHPWAGGVGNPLPHPWLS